MIINMEHIARLAQLEFSEKEKEEIYKNIENIINMVGDLPDIINVESLDENIMELRPDDIHANKFTNEEMLSNAPVTHNGCISVPKTVE